MARGLTFPPCSICNCATSSAGGGSKLGPAAVDRCFFANVRDAVPYTKHVRQRPYRVSQWVSTGFTSVSLVSSTRMSVACCKFFLRMLFLPLCSLPRLLGGGPVRVSHWVSYRVSPRVSTRFSGFQHGLAGFNFNRFHTAFHTGSCSGVLDRHRASPWGFTLGFTTGFRAAVTFTELVRRRTGTGFMMGFTTGFLQLLVFVVCKCVCPLAIAALPNSLPPW